MPKPVIAALPGAAAGAGFALALACDLRIAAENAVLLTAFARVGFSGDYGGTYFATQVVGAAKARELYFLSERVERAGGAAHRPREPRRARGGAREADARARAAPRERSRASRTAT